MKIEILGNTQDGGVPHLGCECDVCNAAHDNPGEAKYVSSIMLKENQSDDSVRYIIDASPDIRYQIQGEYIDGVFLTHSGLGHVTGLLYFGREGPDASSLNVYCSEEVENFLMKNDPYRFLVDRGNIETHTMEDEEETDIQGGNIEVRQFDHSALNQSTTGFIIEGEKRKMFYLSDIDHLGEEVLEILEEVDIAIIDGTFYSEGEIDRYDEVPHPTIEETLESAAGIDTEIYFTHLNHTNPALRKDSEERKKVEEAGFGVVERGDEFEI